MKNILVLGFCYTNNPVVNTFVHIFWKTFVSVVIGVIPRSGVAGQRVCVLLGLKANTTLPARKVHSINCDEHFCFPNILASHNGYHTSKKKKNSFIPLTIKYKITRNKLDKYAVAMWKKLEYAPEGPQSSLKKWKLCHVLGWEFVAWWKYSFSFS